MKVKHLRSLMLVFVMCTFAVLGGVILTACGHQHSWTYQLVDETGHSHYRICKGCGEKVMEECTLEVTEQHDATCDRPKETVHTCIVCHFSHTHTEGTERGHDWGTWTPLYNDDDTTDDKPGEYLKQHAKFCKHDNTHVTDIESCESYMQEDVVAPSCSEIGYTKHTCSRCGGSYTTDEKAATGHNWKDGGAWKEEYRDGKHFHYRECENPLCDLPDHKFVEECADDGVDMILQSTIQATCDDPSTEKYKCNKCNREVETHNVEALGHSYNEFEYVGHDDTHEHKKICTRPLAEGGTCGHEETEECNFEDTLIPATCQEKGYTSHTCRVCSHNYKDNEQAELAHLWTEYYVTADGAHERKCERENNVHYERHEANYREETTPEDCENAEHTKLTCQFEGCGHVEEFDGNQAKGHVEGVWTYCGEGDEHKHQKSCTVCGKVLKTEECVFTAVDTKETCETDGFTTYTCKDCPKTYQVQGKQRTGHAYSEWQTDGDRHYRICQNDNSHKQEHIIQKSESRQQPTCTEAGKLTITCLHEENGQRCDVQIETPIDPLGHLWNVGDETIVINGHAGHENVKCMRVDCNETHSGKHVYTKNNLCDMCGWDGLVYTAKGNGTAIVSSDRNVEHVKEIIIPDATPMWNAPDVLEEGQVLGGIKIVEIDTAAFLLNPNVEKITLGKNITNIDDGAAHGCKKLKTLVLNEGLQTIRTDAFQESTLLETICVMEADGQISELKIVPSTITYISSSAFKNTAFEKNLKNWTEITYTKQDADPEVVGKGLILGNQLVKVMLDEGKDTFEVPETVVSIAEDVFRNMQNLVTIVLPKTITSIGANAFYGCQNLTHAIFRGDVAGWLAISFGNDYSSPTHYAKTFTIKETESTDLVINDNISTIPAGCFYGDNLTSVVIGEGVTSIGAGAFENCTNLASITIKSKKLIYIGENAFKGTAFYDNPAKWDEDGALYIGEYLIDVKEEAEGKDTTVEIDEDVQTTRKVFTVKEGTTLIACGAFRNCTKLQHIVIAKTVSRIGTNAFVGCSLSTLTILDTEHVWMVWTSTMGRGTDVTNAVNNAVNASTNFVGEWYWYGTKKSA